ncbi:gfo/Idh/MocA family oxidoreductase [Clostridiales bacterium COT073_COT-073]|nr:gfo/Idh/MocA family oxidoreductase [Clostridiales bacterium COT073_COT-073]
MNRLNICWGLLGTGDVTEIKGGPGLYKNPNSVLEGVYNRTKEKALRFAFRHGVPKVFNSVDEMLHDKYIDIIYIATPPYTHHEFAIQCLEAGKAVYIEKPLTMNYAQALEIDAKARQKNLPAYAAFYRRGLQKFIGIKDLLDSGQIGAVRMVRVTHWMPATEAEKRGELTWRLQKEMSGGGKFWDLAVHTLDILEFFFGKMQALDGNVTNQGGYYDIDDTVTATFRYENGIVGTGSWCFVADKQVEEVVIAGEKGNLRFSVFGKEAVILEQNGEFELFNYRFPNHIAMPYQGSIVRELLDMGKSNADWEQALDVMKWMDHLYHKSGDNN